MKKFLLIGLVTLANLTAMAQKANEEPFMTKSFSQAFAETKVRTSGGSITVNGGTAGEAKVEVYVHSNNGRNNLSKEEIQQRLDEMYDIDIDVRNNQLVAIAKPKEKIRDWKKALSISFKVFVPEKTATDLATSGGSIHLSKLNGTQNFSTSGGSLHIESVSGTIKGRTSGGSIHVQDAKQDIDLATSGGSIEAKDCEGKISLNTSGGSLWLKNLKGTVKATTSGGSVDGKNIGGELAAHTSGGSIHFEDLACSLETSTSGGSIDVSIKELGKYVRISNSSGNVTLDLPKGKGLDLELEANKVSTDRLENFSGTMKDDEVNGKINGGGVLVRVKAGSGHIHLGLK
jgi:hypothetical protein